MMVRFTFQLIFLYISPNKHFNKVKGSDPFEVNNRVEDPKGADRITDRVKFHSITTESKFIPFSFEVSILYNWRKS